METGPSAPADAPGSTGAPTTKAERRRAAREAAAAGAPQDAAPVAREIAVQSKAEKAPRGGGKSVSNEAGAADAKPAARPPKPQTAATADETKPPITKDSSGAAPDAADAAVRTAPDVKKRSKAVHTLADVRAFPFTKAAERAHVLDRAADVLPPERINPHACVRALARAYSRFPPSAAGVPSMSSIADAWPESVGAPDSPSDTIEYASAVSRACVWLIAAHACPPAAVFKLDALEMLNRFFTYMCSIRPALPLVQLAFRAVSVCLSSVPHDASKEAVWQSVRDSVCAFEEAFLTRTHAVSLACQQHLATRLEGARQPCVVVYGNSPSVVSALTRWRTHGAGDAEVCVVDSHPLHEGRAALDTLRASGFRCTFTDLHGAAACISRASAVVLGCETVCSDGSVVASAGSALIASVAHAVSVPVIIAFESIKLTDATFVDSASIASFGPRAAIAAPAAAEGIQAAGTPSRLPGLFEAPDIAAAAPAPVVAPAPAPAPAVGGKHKDAAGKAADAQAPPVPWSSDCIPRSVAPPAPAADAAIPVLYFLYELVPAALCTTFVCELGVVTVGAFPAMLAATAVVSDMPQVEDTEDSAPAVRREPSEDEGSDGDADALDA